MGLAEDTGDRLAADVLKVIDKLGDPDLITQVSEILGASSTPTQEAFMSAIRVRQADARARAFLRDKLRAAKPDPE